MLNKKIGNSTHERKVNPDYSRMPPRPKPHKSSRQNINRRNNKNP